MDEALNGSSDSRKKQRERGENSRAAAHNYDNDHRVILIV